MKRKPHWIIATDLDGTLLDDTYPLAEAAAVLDQIQNQTCDCVLSVVLASSKTLPEMLHIASFAQQPLYLIFENGGGLAWSPGMLIRDGQSTMNGYQVMKFAASYAEVCRVLARLRQDGFAFRGFADMSVAEIASTTGLTIDAAAMARQRQTSEPIKWLGTPDELTAFDEALRAEGLTRVPGGRFQHISSGASKGLALQYIRGQLRYETGSTPRVLACGDAPNDLDMIEHADRALLFPDRQGRYLREPQKDVVHAPLPGPKHWLAGVQNLFARTPSTH